MVKGASSGGATLLRRFAGVCGITSQLLVLIVLLVAAFSSPQFSWTESNISVLEVEGSAVTLFNFGLILTGILSVTFAIGLVKSLISSRLGRWGITCLILGSMAVSAMGIFPRRVDLPHDLASIAFFMFIALALILVGIAAINAQQMRWGLLSLTTGILIPAFQLVPWPWSGGAIPQLVSCLPWSLWTIFFAIGLLVRPRPVDVWQEGKGGMS